MYLSHKGLSAKGCIMIARASNVCFKKVNTLTTWSSSWHARKCANPSRYGDERHKGLSVTTGGCAVFIVTSAHATKSLADPSRLSVIRCVRGQARNKQYLNEHLWYTRKPLASGQMHDAEKLLTTKDYVESTMAGKKLISVFQCLAEVRYHFHSSVYSTILHSWRFDNCFKIQSTRDLSAPGSWFAAQRWW